MERKWIKIIFLIPLLYLNEHLISAQTTTVSAKLSLKEIFEPGADLLSGITGTVTGQGRISILIRETTYNTIVYEAYINTSSPTYQGIETVYKKEQLGTGGKYYPASWESKDIKSAAYAIDFLKAESASKPYPFLSNPIDVSLEIKEEGTARVELIKIPGLGIINWQGGNQLFDSKHFCYDLKNSDHCACRNWKKYKTPRLDKGSDIMIACHRGLWGFDLGNGAPENSVASIRNVNKYTKVLESDVTITKDKRVLVSHDYNFLRLTNFSGTDRVYVWDKNWSEISSLKLRKRNDAVSDQNLILFDTLIDLLIENELVVNVDIKEIRARSINGVCVDNCEYDPKTHEQAALDKIDASWKEIFQLCVKVAKAKNALQYISFKVPYDWDFMQGVLSEEDAAQILYLPVHQPSVEPNVLEKALNFVDSWILKAGNKVCAYETNFKERANPVANEFIREGVQYENLLHYVYAQTGLKPGGYPDEPSGPKGVSNRFAKWSPKDLTKDCRGDHYLLMSIPYGRISVMTTDRPDIWNSINALYNE